MGGFRPGVKAKPRADQRTLMVRNSLFARLPFALIFTMTLLGVDAGSVAVGLHSSYLHAQVNWFPSPSERLNEPPSRGHSVASKARVLFFIAPGCGLCPEEAAKLEKELKRLGWRYEMEGIFLGGPPQVGEYLAALQSYPFKFELGLDMDGLIAKRFGVKTFPTAVIEVDGKRVVVTRASELSEKLR
jgi:thiol-disulfide isomerase/thioredoxin